MPAVVNVRVERTGTPEAGREQPPPDDPETRDFLERFFGQPLPPNAQPQPHRMVGEGSGFIVSPDGYIVTNFHVAGEADRVTVTTRDGSTYQATLKGADRPTRPGGDQDRGRAAAALPDLGRQRQGPAPATG